MIRTETRVRPPSAERMLWNKIYFYRRAIAVLVAVEVVLVAAIAVLVVKS